VGDEGGKALSFFCQGVFFGFSFKGLGFVDARMSLGFLASFLSSCDI
jgi:hypothetical protein